MSRAGRCSASTPESCGPSGQSGSAVAGAQANRHPATTSTGGSSAASARTIVDLAVPFSPRARTPPIAGETALSRSAVRSSARPTTAEKGYDGSAVVNEPPRDGASRSKYLYARSGSPRRTSDHSGATAPDLHRLLARPTLRVHPNAVKVDRRAAAFDGGRSAPVTARRWPLCHRFVGG